MRSAVVRHQPCTGARWRDSPPDVALRTLRRDTDPRLALRSRERPLVFSTKRPALTRQGWRLSSYHDRSLSVAFATVSPFSRGALRQLRWLRACPLKTNTNAGSLIDQRPRHSRMPRSRHIRRDKWYRATRPRAADRGPGAVARGSLTPWSSWWQIAHGRGGPQKAQKTQNKRQSARGGTVVHLDHIHPRRPVEPVAVALVSLCDVLAASRVW